MPRSPSLGPTIQSKPDICPFCDSRQIVKRGLRRNSLRHLQIYWCKDCGRYFVSLLGLKGVKYPPRVIARTLCLYNLGYSQEQTVRRLASELRINVPRRTISDWIAGYRPITTFQRLRAEALRQYGQKMIRERTLDHQQAYEFKVHLAKLTLTAHAIPAEAAARVESYLFSVFEDFPDHLFQEEAAGIPDRPEAPGDSSQDPPHNSPQNSPRESAQAAAPPMRSSKSRFEILPLARTAKQNLANDLAAMGLLLARKNKERHPSVQDFMLANDSCTVACEVPVYLTGDEIAQYKRQGFFLDLPESPRPITGHIDVVQVRNGMIHLLDYKPKACEIDPVNQLLVYALALGARARIPVKMFKCAWFDEKDYFEFFPLHAVMARPTRA